MIMNCKMCDTELDGKQLKFCSVKCKQKARDQRRNQNPVRKKTVQNRVRDNSIERKIKLVQMLGGSCNKCTYDDNLACLSFHHRNPSEKKFVLTLLNMTKHSMETLIKEAQKCQLLCIRCHFDVEWPQFRGWKTQKLVS